MATTTDFQVISADTNTQPIQDVDPCDWFRIPGEPIDNIYILVDETPSVDGWDGGDGSTFRALLINDGGIRLIPVDTQIDVSEKAHVDMSPPEPVVQPAQSRRNR